jgi:hypothetical protein
MYIYITIVVEVRSHLLEVIAMVIPITNTPTWDPGPQKWSTLSMLLRLMSWRKDSWSISERISGAVLVL